MACTLSSFTHQNGTGSVSTLASIVVTAGQGLATYCHWQPGSGQTVLRSVWNSNETFLQQGTSSYWVLKNPTAGTHNVVTTWSGDPAGRIGTSLWVVDNLDQSTVTRAVVNGPSDPTSAVGDLVLGGMSATFADTNVWSANTDATEDVNTITNVGSGAGAFNMLAEHRAGLATSTPMDFRHTTSDGQAATRREFMALVGAGGGGGATASGAGYRLRQQRWYAAA